MSFPRGGSKPTKRKYAEDNENIFSLKNTTQQKQKAKKVKKTTSTNELQSIATGFSATVADTLTHRTVQEGMLILGCVRKIMSLTIKIELPGRVYALAKINALSDPFTQLMQNELNDLVEEQENTTKLESMFQTGQFVPTKILGTAPNSGNDSIFVSINPTDINRNLNYTHVQNGMLMWAAVKAEADHGYEIDFGITNCRAFLPQKNIEGDRKLMVGQPIWCIIQKSKVSTSSIVEVSVLKDQLEKFTQNKPLSLHCLIPGMKFKFNITETIRNGLRGEFMDDCFGYVNEMYLVNPQDQLSKYREGLEVKSTLLYVQPTTNFAYFSLRCSEIASLPAIPIGQVINAKVSSKINGGLLLNLPHDQKGYTSYKRLLRTLPKKDNLDLRTAINNKYSKGSTHKCRIIDFLYIDQIYICTFEQSIIDEKYFNLDDVNVGEIIPVKVKKITKTGLVVRFGLLEGFVENFHLSNVKYSENIKKKFSVGRSLHAKVWKIDDRGVYFTLKTNLVESNFCLTNYKDAMDDVQYPAVVANIGVKGVLVLFYGGLKGFIPHKLLQQTTEEQPKEIFYEGQVIMVTIRKHNNKYSVSLNPPKSSKRKGIRVGQYVDAVVTAVEDHLLVEAGPNKIEAIILPQHLSSSISLGPLLLKTYNVGDVLKNLLCISDHDTLILSLREGEIHKRENLKISKIEDLKVGSIIRGSYQSSNPDGIYVQVPFKPFKVTLFIFNQELLDPVSVSPDSLNFEPEQPINLKVTKLDTNHKRLRATAKLSQVFNNNYQFSLNRLEGFLRDYKRVEKHFREEDSAMAKLSIGQRVKCVVNQISDEGCSVLLVEDVTGLVQRRFMPDNIKPGQTVNGIVLFVDYQDSFVELALKKEIIDEINPAQTGKIRKSLNTTVTVNPLIMRPEFVMAVIKGDRGNRQLVFLPTQWHENSFFNDIEYTSRKLKVLICKKFNNWLIGVSKAAKDELEKKNEIKKRSNKKQNKKVRFVDDAVQNGVESEDYVTEDKDVEETNGDEGVEDFVDIEDTDNDNEDKDIEETNGAESVEDFDDIEDTDNDNEGVENSEDIEETNTDEDSEESNENTDNYDEELETNATETKNKNSSSLNEMEDEDSEESNDESDDSNLNSSSSISVALPGMHDFFTNGNTNKKVQSSDSSSEDEDVEERTDKRKKKLTPKERAELARTLEEEIRRKEMELADLKEPQNPDQFDRLLLGQPNSSDLWAKYVAFHLSNAEIEKARATTRRALKTIEITETTERFNMWVILLNLEYNYGDKESFNEVFEEAVRCSNALEIYLVVINMLAESQKYTEMEERIKKAKGKFKQDFKMWQSISDIYYKNNKLKEARNFRDIAMQTLINKSDSVKLAVHSAIMEFKYGERYQAEALFEKILESSPKRTDVWKAYVDQMVKLGDIENARRILEKSVVQNIPAKNLKTLFQKFMQFEETYGNQATIQNVRDLTKKFVAKLK